MGKLHGARTPTPVESDGGPGGGPRPPFRSFGGLANGISNVTLKVQRHSAPSAGADGA